MGNYYFDIETTGLDAKTNKIITIQFQELHRNTGEAIGELTILKEWESSEREILKEFIRKSGIEEDYPFTFIPTGYNLGFEHNFLKERTAWGAGAIHIVANKSWGVKHDHVFFNELNEFMPKFQELMDKHEIKLITRPERYVEVKLSK